MYFHLLIFFFHKYVDNLVCSQGMGCFQRYQAFRVLFYFLNTIINCLIILTQHFELI